MEDEARLVDRVGEMSSRGNCSIGVERVMVRADGNMFSVVHDGFELVNVTVNIIEEAVSRMIRSRGVVKR